MSTTSLFRASLILPASAALPVADLLEGIDTPTPVSVSAFEVPGTTDHEIEALYHEPPDAAHLQRILTPLLEALELPVPEITVVVLANRNWVRESLQGLAPVSAGRFFVAGAHDIALAPSGAIGLCIEAGEAFGTGHHESTTGCLLALGNLARRKKFSRMLDLGCGTGVLAMAAAKLWQQPVLASDNDPVAVRVAMENTRRNGLSLLVKPIVATGFASSKIYARAPFDLIIANILARPLLAMAEPMARHLSHDGSIILSGLLSTQEAAIRSAYRIQGLYLEAGFRQAGWSTLVLRR